jgi:hypothetical protein
MTAHVFYIVLRKATLTDAECDALYEAGCDDATVVTREGVTRLAFDRAAESLEQALSSAAADVRAAGFEIQSVEMDAPAPVSRAN